MKLITSFIFVLTLFISSCAPQEVLPQVQTPSLPVATQQVVEPTITSEPSPTPLPGKVLLVARPDRDSQIEQAVLAELASSAGLDLEVVPDLQPAALTSNVHVVVVLTAPANLNELIAAAPQTQFAVFSGVDLPGASNLTVVRYRLEYQAFLAGFISVLLSTDWRVAGLLPADGPLGAGLQDAFINGGRYFCGLCGPGWPVGVYYPQVTELPAGSDGAAWQSAAAGLYDNMKVEAYFLSAEAAKPEVSAFLQGKDQFGKLLLVVGTQPPPDELRGQWAATVGFDTAAALRQVWPDLVAGKGGAVVEAALALSDVNSDNLSEGRLRLVNELIEEIQAGRVYPFSLPQE